MYKTLSDNELLNLMQRDDEAAFNELYLRYWEKLMAISLKRVKDVDVAQDIMQEVFVNIWKSRHRTEIRQPENYMATSVKFLSISYLRSQKKARLVDELDEAVFLYHDATAEQLLYTKDLISIIQKEVNSLPPVCQLVFRYSRLEGRSTKEIAAEMNLAEQTVKNHLTKALQHFRKILKMAIFIFFIYLWIFFSL